MKIKKITLIILTIITLLSCDDKQPEALIITNYPMSVGTSWTYERLWILRNYKSYSSDSIVNSDTIKIKGTIWIDKDTTINNTKLMVFKTQEIELTQTTTSTQYFYMDKNGLKLYAYNYGGNILFSKNSQTSNMQNVLQTGNIERMYSHKQANSEIYIYSIPVLNIKYPLTLNSEWISDFSGDNSIPITKKVIGTDTLRINGLDYVCLKVMCNYPAGNFVVSNTQWISKDGVLKSETNFGTNYDTDVYGNKFNKYESLEFMTVISVSIK